MTHGSAGDAGAKAMTAAIAAIATAIRRSQQAIVRFAPGTSHHSLLIHRIRALQTASVLLSMQTGERPVSNVPDEDMRNAVAPLTSLLHKSEKARMKLSAGSWQAVMLDEQTAALRTALAVMTDALEQINGGSV